jgi:hypothetical protein
MSPLGDVPNCESKNMFRFSNVSGQLATKAKALLGTAELTVERTSVPYSVLEVHRSWSEEAFQLEGFGRLQAIGFSG